MWHVGLILAFWGALGCVEGWTSHPSLRLSCSSIETQSESIHVSSQVPVHLRALSLDWRGVAQQWGLCVVRRVDREADLLHFDFYRRPWLARLPQVIRQRLFRPLAKAGMRLSSTPVSASGSDGMVSILAEAFPAQAEPVRSSTVSCLIYMWATPAWRGNGLGDMLLACIAQESRSRGDDYLLCVHDDDGSGGLVRWYESRGFVDASTVLPKGLVQSLK